MTHHSGIGLKARVKGRLIRAGLVGIVALPIFLVLFYVFGELVFKGEDLIGNQKGGLVILLFASWVSLLVFGIFLGSLVTIGWDGFIERNRKQQYVAILSGVLTGIGLMAAFVMMISFLVVLQGGVLLESLIDLWRPMVETFTERGAVVILILLFLVVEIILGLAVHRQARKLLAYQRELEENV